MGNDMLPLLEVGKLAWDAYLGEVVLLLSKEDKLVDTIKYHDYRCQVVGKGDPARAYTIYTTQDWYLFRFITPEDVKTLPLKGFHVKCIFCGETISGENGKFLLMGTHQECLEEDNDG